MNAWMRAVVPARHRVLFGTLTQQMRRSATGSQCDRQATQLLVLLSGADMRIDECVALLDGDEERWLTDGRSHALVDATLQEAMARAWCDPRTARDRETMRAVVDRLEALEAHLIKVYPVRCADEGDAVERALLRHLGRGCEVLCLEKKQRAKRGVSFGAKGVDDDSDDATRRLQSARGAAADAAGRVSGGERRL
jgi:hypothetical protein